LSNQTTSISLIARITFAGTILALLAAVTALLAASGTKNEWWDFRTGFIILKWGAYSGAIAGFLCLAGGLWASTSGQYKTAFIAAASLLLSMIVMGIPWSWKQTASKVPPIHDISTDLTTPPKFIAILPLRKNAPNTSTHGGEIISSQQLAAYPNITSLLSEHSTDQIFAKTIEVIDDLGWEIIDASPPDRRIEAVDTTFWFGFKDDIVIRILPIAQGSKVDIRSVSRVGRSDVGSNAKRIQVFLDAMASHK